MKDIDDDQTGKYAILARQIGESSAMFPDERILRDVAARRFFAFGLRRPVLLDTDHAIGNSGIQSNLITVKLLAPQGSRLPGFCSTVHG